jgi:hypothetical protein
MIQETLQVQVRARALKDPAFRQALLSNPRAVLAKEYNVLMCQHFSGHKISLVFRTCS